MKIQTQTILQSTSFKSPNRMNNQAFSANSTQTDELIINNPQEIQRKNIMKQTILDVMKMVGAGLMTIAIFRLINK